MRKAVLLLAAGGAAVAYLRRRRPTPERVDLYFEDGSMISLSGDSGRADRLVQLSRDVLAAARA